MDKQFIDNMVDAYFLDNNIYETIEITRNFYTNKLFEDIKLLREEDLEIYDKIYNTTRICQNRIIKNYLDTYLKEEQDEEILEESVTLGLGVVLITILGLLFNRPITQFTFKTLNNLSKEWKTFTNWLGKLGGTTRVRYAIIQRNIEKCYKDCKVNPKEVTAGHYAGVTKETPWWASLTANERLQIGDCLANCYIEHLIESINLLMENYFACLRQNGVDLKDAENDLIKFIARVDVSSVCKEFYEQAKRAFEIFEKTIEVVSSGDKTFEQKAYNQLREKLYQTRQKVERSVKPQQQNNQQRFQHQRRY